MASAIGALNIHPRQSLNGAWRGAKWPGSSKGKVVIRFILKQNSISDVVMPFYVGFSCWNV
jgi:hypothetical protein